MAKILCLIEILGSGGALSQIMPGVTIGEGALVAAGSVVTKSVAPHTVVPARPDILSADIRRMFHHVPSLLVG